VDTETCRHCGKNRQEHSDTLYCRISQATYEPGPTREELIGALNELLKARLTPPQSCFNTSHQYAVQDDCEDCQVEMTDHIVLERARDRARAALGIP